MRRVSCGSAEIVDHQLLVVVHVGVLGSGTFAYFHKLLPIISLAPKCHDLPALKRQPISSHE